MDYPERMTYRQAVGEEPIDSPVFFPGADFDPYDEDEVEVVRLASERHAADELARLRRENEDLRTELAGRSRVYDELKEFVENYEWANADGGEQVLTLVTDILNRNEE